MSCTCGNMINLFLIVHLFPTYLLHPTMPPLKSLFSVKWHFATMDMRALILEFYEYTLPSRGLGVKEVKKKKWTWRWFARFDLIPNLLFFGWLFNLGTRSPPWNNKSWSKDVEWRQRAQKVEVKHVLVSSFLALQEIPETWKSWDKQPGTEFTVNFISLVTWVL